MKKNLLFLLLPLFTAAQDTIDQRLLTRTRVNGVAILAWKGEPFTGVAAQYKTFGDKADTVAASYQSYKDGKKNGRFVGFDHLMANTGGVITTITRQEAIYMNDTMVGKRKTFFDDGNLSQETCYRNNREHGTMTFFNRKGRPMEQYTYAHGKRTGPYSAWHINNVLRISGSYDDGKPSGTWTHYYGDGKPRKEDLYHAGKVYRTTWLEGVNLQERHDTSFFAFNGIGLGIPSAGFRLEDAGQLCADTIEMDQSSGSPVWEVVISATSYSVNNIELFISGESAAARPGKRVYTKPVQLQRGDWYYHYPVTQPSPDGSRPILLIIKGKGAKGKKINRVFRITPVSGC